MKNEEVIEQKQLSFLTFQLGKESFAIPVTKVIEILEVPPITKVPKSPEFMTGVINLRGNVLPVVDTRIKFGLDPMVFSIHTCILVISVEVEGESAQVGALVDSVQEVLEVDQNQVGPSPGIGAKYKTEFIEGMIRNQEHFIMLIDMDKVFSTDEIIMINEVENKEE